MAALRHLTAVNLLSRGTASFAVHDRRDARFGAVRL
jgi:hypothetical protein